MGTYLHALSAVFMIFSLMAVGYVLGMLGWMDESDVKYVEAGDNTLPFIDQNIDFNFF